MFRRMFPARAALSAGGTLYAGAARQARRPALFRELGAPDTAEGRFEVLSLHVALLLLRLKGQGEEAAETAQHVFDAFVQALDDAMRELGVADISMGKRMRKLGAAFYGRMRSYEEALSLLPDRRPLEALIARTVLEGGSGERAGPIADYAARAADALASSPLEALLEGSATWPQA
jgi:cytochrome b pre-mRNA-processing protein 3